jgi:hypothetical protein
LRDDIGDNISDKNALWSELTAHYWLWKNDSHPVIGLCHYRRLFFTSNDMQDRELLTFETARVLAKQTKLPEVIDELVSDNDIIVPTPIERPPSLHIHYIECHRAADWAQLFLTWSEIDAYEAAQALEFFRRETLIVPYNMMIGHRKVLEQYYNWLFPLLEATSDNLTGFRDKYQSRAVGFMAERLFTWWLHRTKLSVAHLPVGLIAPPGRATALLSSRKERK